MRSKIIPDLQERPHSLKFEKVMQSNAEKVYDAWTIRFDTWFAQPGEFLMTPEIDRPFFFYNSPEHGRHAHYGRFIELEKNRIIEMTWVSGKGATYGAETVLRIELEPHDQGGTLLRMSHSGFQDEASMRAHEAAWLPAMDILDQTIQSGS